MNDGSKKSIPGIKPFYFDGSHLARNTIYNLIGYISPIPVALITIPILVKALGTDRFGILTIAWMVIGYFSLFDMGIGRATTKFVAEYAARGEYHVIRRLVTTSLILLLLFGIIAGAIVFFLTGWMVTVLLNIPPDLIEESRQAFYLLSVSIPLVLLIAGTKGVLEAQQKFGVINAIKIPSSLATLLAPIIVLPFSHNLYPIVGMLVISKAISLMFYSYYCWKYLEKSSPPSPQDKGMVGMLMRFGGWLSISNIIAPMMGNLDRFFIGSILTMTAVTYYVTPYDMITRSFVIPIGILGVIFPAFSAYAAANEKKLVRLHKQAIKYILIVMTPLVIALIIFAKPFLQLWLSEEFADQSSLVLQILAAGVLFSSVGRVPLNAIQALGRPDITAKLLLLELPLYLTAVFLMTRNLGILGVAIVWTSHLIIEMIILIILIERLKPFSEASTKVLDRSIYLWMSAIVAVSYLISLIPNILLMASAAIIFVSATLYLAYIVILDEEERSALLNIISRISNLRNGSSLG
ncbi:MAG: hypothetical protein CVT49_06975 [candidate division Zixibacteria bacterium HGW-Zixibacteria-1]|nr:MAG: hypothetical protein CVT49_06975 [candidate division Zixibacteria bacterium HGW-Zixibacteria-1]